MGMPLVVEFRVVQYIHERLLGAISTPNILSTLYLRIISVVQHYMSLFSVVFSKGHRLTCLRKLIRVLQDH